MIVLPSTRLRVGCITSCFKCLAARLAEPSSDALWATLQRGESLRKTRGPTSCSLKTGQRMRVLGAQTCAVGSVRTPCWHAWSVTWTYDVLNAATLGSVIAALVNKRSCTLPLRCPHLGRGNPCRWTHSDKSSRVYSPTPHHVRHCVPCNHHSLSSCHRDPCDCDTLILMACLYQPQQYKATSVPCFRCPQKWNVTVVDELLGETLGHLAPPLLRVM